MDLEDYMGLGRWRFDMRTGEVELDAAMARLYGLAVPAGQGWRGPGEVVTNLIVEEDRPLAAMADADERLEVGDLAITVSRPYRLVHPDSKRWVRLFAGQRKGEDWVEGYIVDAGHLVTARQRQAALEPLAQRAERFAAAETLAAPLAHDLANLMTPILAALDLVEADLAEEDDNRELVTIAGRAAAAALPMLRRLVGIVRESPGSLACALGDAALPTLELLRRVVPATITLQADLHDTGARVALAEGEVIQVLTNVVLNASQAVGDVAGAVRVSSHAAESGVVLRIEDDGPGFDAARFAEIERGLETTKAEGTGLGLMMVRSVIERRGGSVRLENRPEGGARVDLWLPLAAAFEASDAAAAPLDGDGRLVLLQPGEEGLSRTLVQVLRRHGFEVRTSHGVLAATVHAQRDAVSLVVVVEGAEEPERACRTGYAGDPPCLWVGSTPRAGVPSMVTPFTLDELTVVLRDALRGSSAA